MTHPNPSIPEAVTLTLLKSADAPKLGKRSAGQSIHYCLWTNDQRSDVWWQIAGNVGGQHSLELVATDKIQATLDTQAGGEPFRTKQLRSSFRGKSQNNSGFLLCALYAEGLVRADEKAHHHVRSESNWTMWRDVCLASAGEPKEIAMPLALTALPADTAEPVTKERRSGKRRTEASPEDGHAGAE